MDKLIRMVLVSGLLAGNAYADGFNMSVGGDYSTGKYGGSQSTDVFYMPFTGTYETGAFTYKVTVPWLSVRGTGDVVPSGIGGSGASSSVTTTAGSFGCAGDNRKGANKPEDDGVCANAVNAAPTPTPATNRRRTTESGLGDVVASVGYNLLDTQDWAIALTGRVKFATANEHRGLGSGKNDYAVQFNVDKYFGAPYVSFGLGYKKLGQPRGVDYRAVAYGSLGAGYKFGDKGDMGISYDWATAAVSGVHRPQEVALYGSYRISNQYKLSGVLYGGLADVNPDVGGGVTLSYYF